MSLKCESCGWTTTRPQTSRQVRYARNYYWHIPCAGKRGPDFPGKGKLIPETIIHK